MVKYLSVKSFDFRMSSKEGGASTKGGRGKPKASKSVSRSQKAGLEFPVGKIARFLKGGKYVERVGTGAPVSLRSPRVSRCQGPFSLPFRLWSCFFNGGLCHFLVFIDFGSKQNLLSN